METRIYEIGSGNTAKVTALLEGEDKFDVTASCQKCGKDLKGLFTVTETSRYESKEDSRGKPKPPEKKCECGGDFKFEKKVLVVNEFSRNGYTFRAGYLYIKADPEFFTRNEKALLAAGAKHAPKDVAEKIRKEIESENDSAAAGVGLIFG